MNVESLSSPLQPIVLHFSSVLQQLNGHHFFEFCRVNPEWHIERTSEGELIIVVSTGGRAVEASPRSDHSVAG